MTCGEYGNFHVLWQQWPEKLRPLVVARGARLEFPSLSGPHDVGDGKVEFRTSEPILIANAPQKSASNKSGRHAIFILGTFVFGQADDTERPKLVHATASVTIYNVTHETDAAIAQLFEAVHFDMEDAQNPTAFHPIFHAQRGADNRLSEAQVRRLLKRALRLGRGVVNIADSQVPGTPYLRLPTPQLDLFSVLTMLIADFLCHTPQGRRTQQLINSNTHTLFKAVLKLLQAEENIARDGACTEVLDIRRAQAGNYASSAHWYAESI